MKQMADKEKKFISKRNEMKCIINLEFRLAKQDCQLKEVIYQNEIPTPARS